MGNYNAGNGRQGISAANRGGGMLVANPFGYNGLLQRLTQGEKLPPWLERAALNGFVTKDYTGRAAR